MRGVEVARAAAAFMPRAIESCEPATGGHIHRSYRCAVRGARGTETILLQQLNASVFKQPELMMANVQRVTSWLGRQVAADGRPDAERRYLTLLAATDGRSWWIDDDGCWWRAFRFIPGALTIAHAGTPEQVFAAGAAFGRFQAMMAGLDGPPLHDVLPGFHDTPARLAALEAAAQTDAAGRAAEARRDIDAVLAERERAGTVQRPGLPGRVVHHDAKLANVLFDAASGEALCVIDLDTVTHGLAVHDFGDMARSMAGSGAEDEPDATAVVVSLGRFEALVRGYLGAAAFLTSVEREHLVDGALVITLEQAMRFLTDYLDGDRYYPASRPRHNLDRARSQFALYRSLEQHDAELRRIVREAGA